MRTTLYINDSLILSIKRYAGNLNKTEIINHALEEYLARLKREKLKNAFGKIQIDLDVREYRNRQSNE
ncbi:MAG: type II toxin-antitoxin system VapB family antitoxin [Candidatus Aminicenantes bacterium]|nr:type II toxin-antitoxin system VapB family antitoxin [Candidatus Aminicenantes bacterium]